MAQERFSGHEFFDLVTSSDSSVINRISNGYCERLTIYLITVYGADENTARDCAQEAFGKIYEKVVNKKLKEVEDIFGYMIGAVKNEYRMTIRREKFEVPIEQSHYAELKTSTGDEIIEGLYSEERKNLLEYCIEQLKKKRKSFFLTVLKYIHENDSDAARLMNISYSNFRTRKSRVIESLRDCVKNADPEV